MSFLIIAGERYALEIGETTLGGVAADFLDVPSLAAFPAFAVIDHPIDGGPSIRATGALPVTLNGTPLAADPRALQHGDRIAAASLTIVFGDMRTGGRTGPSAGLDADGDPVLAGGSTPTATTGGRLIHVATGTAHPVPESGLTIGRDPDAGVPLESKDVSRLHAVIAPGLLGYTLTDRSSNGVIVNGARLDGMCVLGQRDVVRIGGEEFRFEADEASFENAAPSGPGIVASAPSPASAVAHPPRLLAVLEVVSEGPLAGKRFRVERSAVQLGRGAQNDVDIGNDSVSGSHASLFFEGGHWWLVDLGSRNGTWVDGTLVRERTALPRVGEIRVGGVTLVFRAIGVASTGVPVRGVPPGSRNGDGTIGVIGLRD